MTREDAIYYLKSSGFSEEQIDTIEQALSQEPCDDAISRSGAIKAIDERAKQIKNEDTLIGLAGAVGILFELPSVTQKSETVTEFADRCRECGAKYGKLLKQQPKTGHWIKEFVDVGIARYRCSECGKYQLINGENYCPNCGSYNGGEQHG